MRKEEINTIFNGFNTLKVLVIGDVMVDAYMWGDVDRISPEAPVPVVAVNKRETRLGGAANVALNIKAMGAEPVICTVVGDDEKGKLFVDLLMDNDLSTECVLQSTNRCTTVKTRVIGSNHQMIRVDEEVDMEITEEETGKLFTVIGEVLENTKIDVIVFEDYDKGVITASLIEKVVADAKKRDIPTIADPKKRNFTSYMGITVFKPNIKELQDGLKEDFDHTDRKKLDEVVSSLRSAQNIDTVLLTLSELGIYVSSNDFNKVIPAHFRDISDVSGAGDTVISIAALCLAQDLSPEHIAVLSNLAGGQVCEKVGVVPLDKTEFWEETHLLLIG